MEFYYQKPLEREKLDEYHFFEVSVKKDRKLGEELTYLYEIDENGDVLYAIENKWFDFCTPVFTGIMEKEELYEYLTQFIENDEVVFCLEKPYHSIEDVVKRGITDDLTKVYHRI